MDRQSWSAFPAEDHAATTDAMRAQQEATHLTNLPWTVGGSMMAALQLDKEQFIDTWPAAVDAAKHAVDYFKSNLRVPVSQLLPYKALLVPFAYFAQEILRRHPNILKDHRGGG